MGITKNLTWKWVRNVTLLKKIYLNVERYSEVIDTARAESFFRDVPMPISRQVPPPLGTRSCFASKKNQPTSSFTPWKSNCRSRQKSLALAHNNKSDGGQKKMGEPKAIYRKGFVCMAGIYIYIFRAGKRLSLLICKSRRDAVSLLIENHRESKNCPRSAFFSNICPANSIHIYTRIISVHIHLCIPI